MESITVDASVQYDVLIGNATANLLCERLRALFRFPKVCIVSDSNVAPLHLSSVRAQLDAEGFLTQAFVFPAGEQSKTPQTLFLLLSFLAEHQFSRNDVLVALGGGITCDLTGLASALYMRGMGLVFMPTSLLAMADASVGGKTAVNLPQGKNLAGVFRQPDLVLCDLGFLDTLPPALFADGMAEVIKCGVIADRALFDRVKNGAAENQLEIIIASCVRIKRDIVLEDEFDHGKRALLNFGHTLGHAIERKSNFSISHGAAIAMGMAAISVLAEQKGWTCAPVASEITRALHANHLKKELSFPLSSLFEASVYDKKRTGKELTLVLPAQIGRCFLKKVSLDEWKELLGA